MKGILISVLFFPLVFLCQEISEGDSLAATMQAEDSTTVEVTRLHLNSAQSDFCPRLGGNTLYFVSGRNNKAAIKYVDAGNRSEMTDLFSVGIKDSLHFGKVKKLGKDINSNFYEGPFCMNKNGDIIYFSANDKNSGQLKIYRSLKIENKWTRPVILPFCKAGQSYCHPALSPDERALVYSSRQAADSSGMDLFVSHFRDSLWQDGVKLPGEMNSGANEIFPFITTANELYFSSDRANGMGGLDIYHTAWVQGSSNVVSPGPPLNSKGDDFGICFDSTGRRGYFASNRQDRSGDDIFYFREKFPDFTDASTPGKKENFCFVFVEENTKQLADTLNYVFEWDFGDGTTARGLKTKHCYRKDGNYKVELNVVEKNSGVQRSTRVSYLLPVKSEPSIYITASDSAFVNEALFIDGSRSTLKGYELQKFYWAFGDGKYTSGKKVSHRFRGAGEYHVELRVVALNNDTKQAAKFTVSKTIRVIEPKTLPGQ